MRTRLLLATTTFLFMFMCLGLSGLGQTERQLPPAWPYGMEPLPPGEIPEQAPPSPPPPVRPPAPRTADTPLLQAEGSRFQFSRQEVSNNYGPADWFPEDHPTMPDVVAHGKPGIQRACGLCHLPNGRGRPENAPIQGLPHDYIVQQLQDFRAGLRGSAEPRKANTGEMANIARALSPAEIEEVATYFSSIPVPKYIRVVETETIPAVRPRGEIFYPVEGGGEEPLGLRIIETPEDVAQTQLRSPRSGFIAYVPVGSVARGEALATTGGNGKTTTCTICHGVGLKGLGPVPNLAGRSPSYLARQLYDIKIGTRHGAWSPLMVPVVANLTDADIIDLVAYVSSLEP